MSMKKTKPKVQHVRCNHEYDVCKFLNDNNVTVIAITQYKDGTFVEGFHIFYTDNP